MSRLLRVALSRMLLGERRRLLSRVVRGFLWTTAPVAALWIATGFEIGIRSEGLGVATVILALLYSCLGPRVIGTGISTRVVFLPLRESRRMWPIWIVAPSPTFCFVP